MADLDEMVGAAMEVWTLLKANIRHKKGSFFSIVLLMIIISMSLTAVLSIRKNCRNSLIHAFETVDGANLTAFIRADLVTDELLTSLETHKNVERITGYASIATRKVEVNQAADNNCWFLQKLRPQYRLLTDDLRGYQKETPALKSSEIYVTQGICTKMECNIGDIVTAHTIAGSYEFTIRGIIAEPSNGASNMGWKQVFISDADYERLYAEGAAAETEEKTAIVQLLHIHKTDDCTLSDGQFKRQLNLETSVVDYSFGTITRDASIHYTNLFPEIIGSVLMVFIGFLMVVVLIVMGHSISTGIEMDYVNLGVLKSQGFSKGKIRIILGMQYLFAEIIGVVLGMILAIPLTSAIGDIFQPITAIPSENRIAIAESVLILTGVLLISVLFVTIITAKVGRISPVRAISGGRAEIYFDSRVTLPIHKKGLSASLALRQFTANKKQFIGLILIVSILVFFMMAIMILGNALNSKSAVESMGAIYLEVDVNFRKSLQDEEYEQLESVIREYSEIEKSYYMSSLYLSLNGEELYCSIYRDPEMIPGIQKGRAPLYENEIVITNIVAEELGLKMGDKVIVSHSGEKAEYIISGLNQSLNDTGLCFFMSHEGAKRLGDMVISFAGYRLAQPEQREQIAAALNAEFGDFLEANAIEESILDGTYTMAINAMKAVIYLFSVIFSLVVVHMVCSKTFLRERTDIGIYKSLGFTSQNLRLQFAVRFLIIAGIGTIGGTLLSVLGAGSLLSTLLRGIGITSFAVSFRTMTFVLPITLICGCFFVFAYIISRKIKSVAVRELVTE